jgi:hypothetical protein
MMAQGPQPPGLLVYKIATSLCLSLYTVTDIALFSKDVLIIETDNYVLHVWKLRNRPSSQEKNVLVSHLAKESNKGDAWMYALHKQKLGVVDIDELGLFLRRTYDEIIGIFPTAENDNNVSQQRLMEILDSRRG